MIKDCFFYIDKCSYYILNGYTEIIELRNKYNLIFSFNCTEYLFF